MNLEGFQMKVDTIIENSIIGRDFVEIYQQIAELKEYDKNFGFILGENNKISQIGNVTFNLIGLKKDGVSF